MRAAIGGLVLSMIACGCPRRPAIVPSESSSSPACAGPPIPWDEGARGDAVRVITRSLSASSAQNPLGVADGASELRAEGREYFVLVPEGVTVPVLPGLHRVDARPGPDDTQPDVPVWSVQIEIVDRYRDGYLYRIEEQTEFFGGPTSRLVNLACGRMRDGEVVIVHLDGVAT
jgi:hypothetical protein